jgi:hypothetical protein
MRIGLVSREVMDVIRPNEQSIPADDSPGASYVKTPLEREMTLAIPSGDFPLVAKTAHPHGPAKCEITQLQPNNGREYFLDVVFQLRLLN